MTQTPFSKTPTHDDLTARGYEFYNHEPINYNHGYRKGYYKKEFSIRHQGLDWDYYVYAFTFITGGEMKNGVEGAQSVGCDYGIESGEVFLGNFNDFDVNGKVSLPQFEQIAEKYIKFVVDCAKDVLKWDLEDMP